MSLIVQKYGGTSVADPERIREVAAHIVRGKRAGNDVLAVVSAMGDTTDELVELADQVSPRPHPRELDMLLTAGERISMALLSMAINDQGEPAQSFTGSQAGIVTDTRHGRAKIVDVRADRLRQSIAEGNVVIVAGFQGVSTDFDITTLGRGGSDTTAVALAHVLGAEVCEIYTDVSGVFTADPRVVSDARKLAGVSYEEMLEMAATGGRVLALRSVEFARNYDVPLHVRSSFTWEPGTWVRPASERGTDSAVEQAIISGVTHDTSEAKLTIERVPDKPGIAAQVFRTLADAGVNVDMIVQNVSHEGTTDISFTVPKEDLDNAGGVVAQLVSDIGAAGSQSDTEIGRVSLVGAGMKTHPGVAAQMFEVLADEGINIEMISTSSIRISIVVHDSDVEPAVRVLHQSFGLGSSGSIVVGEESA